MYAKYNKLAVSMALFLFLIAGIVPPVLAADQIKNYRWNVDRQITLAGKLLEPGRYDVQVICSDNQKAQIVIMLKNRMLLKAEALLEQMPEANSDDGLRVVLPDGKTRIVQKLWFRGGKYLLNLEPPAQAAVADAQPRP